MKSFDDLTKEEKAQLTQDAIQLYIDLECADAGLPMLPEIPPKPVAPVVVPDTKVYEVAGHCVPTLLDAQVLLAAFVQVQTLDYKYNTRLETTAGTCYVHEVREYNQGTKIERKPAMTQELYNTNKLAIESYNTEKAEYDRIYSKFTKAKESRSNIIQAITDSCIEARQYVRQFEQYKKDFLRYVELAEGNKQIAWNFITKANPDLAEEYPGLEAELVTPEFVPAPIEEGF
jgi:hypothetical protein